MQDKMQPPTGSKDQKMEADQNGSRKLIETTTKNSAANGIKRVEKGKRQTASGDQNNVFFYRIFPRDLNASLTQLNISYSQKKGLIP